MCVALPDHFLLHETSRPWPCCGLPFSFTRRSLLTRFAIFPALGQLGTVNWSPWIYPISSPGRTYNNGRNATSRNKKSCQRLPISDPVHYYGIASVVIYTPEYGKMAIGEARESFFYFFFPVLTLTSIKTFANLHRLLLAVFFLAVGVSVLGYLNLFMGASTSSTCAHFPLTVR